MADESSKEIGVDDMAIVNEHDQDHGFANGTANGNGTTTAHAHFNSEAVPAPMLPSANIEEEKAEDPASPQEAFNPGWPFYLTFITLSTITLIVALDATSLSVALPIIAYSLGGTAIEAFWSGTSFLLASTVFQPVFASLSHIFGRKPIVSSVSLSYCLFPLRLFIPWLCLYPSCIFSLSLSFLPCSASHSVLMTRKQVILVLILFTIGAIVCAVANNFTTLLIGRSLQGVGGGGIIALTEIIVTDLVPLRLRGQWFGFLGMMWAIGSVSGPLVGGAFAQNGSFTLPLSQMLERFLLARERERETYFTQIGEIFD